jgi:hypothetical protein
MSAANPTNMGDILKKIWHNKLESVWYEDAPFLAMVPKDTGWTGDTFEVVLAYGMPAGRSCTFSTALSQRAASTVDKMSITRSRNFGIWSVDQELIAITKKDAGAVEEAFKGETERTIKKLKRSMCWMLWGDGGGAIGQLSAAPAANVITLNDKSKVRNFEIGDVLVAYDGSGAIYTTAPTVRNGGATATVTAVDFEAGTVTVDSAPGAWTTSDYLFPAGDFQSCFVGVKAYVPNVATSSTGTLFGLLRTSQRQRLAGLRVGGKGMSIEAAVKFALTKGTMAGATPSHIFMNPTDYYALEMSNQSKKLGSPLSEKVGTVGFSGLVFTKPGGGDIRVYPDADLDANLIYGLDLSKWKLRTAGAFPDFLTANGQQYDLEPTANALMGRVGGYGQLICTNPGANWVCDLTLAPNL